MKYRRPDGKENKLNFGSYPDVPLARARARERRDAARQLLAQGVDPGTALDEKMKAARNTFEMVARDWHRLNLPKWTPRTAQNTLHRLEMDIFPAIGSIAIDQVTIPQVLDAIRAIEARGALEVASRLTAVCVRIFNFAVRSGLADRNPAALLKEVLQPREPQKFAAISSDPCPAVILFYRAEWKFVTLDLSSAPQLVISPS